MLSLEAELAEQPKIAQQNTHCANRSDLASPCFVSEYSDQMIAAKRRVVHLLAVSTAVSVPRTAGGGEWTDTWKTIVGEGETGEGGREAKLDRIKYS